MKNVILEGPDGTGKSTFAKQLLSQMPGDWTIQEGMGPPKYPGEMTQRIISLLDKTNTIFDRHPVISEPIYGRFRETPEIVPMSLTEHFYASNPILVYFPLQLEHETNEKDTPDHLNLLQGNWKRINQLYDEWQDNYNPHYTYMAGKSDPQILINLLKGDLL